jgi:hypothetical protein
MLLALVPLEAVNELPFPAPVFGLIAFGALMIALVFVLVIGASRPHS